MVNYFGLAVLSTALGFYSGRQTSDKTGMHNNLSLKIRDLLTSSIRIGGFGGVFSDVRVPSA